MTFISSCLDSATDKDVASLLERGFALTFGRRGAVAVIVPLAFLTLDPSSSSPPSAQGSLNVASVSPPRSPSLTFEDGAQLIVVPDDGIPVMVTADEQDSTPAPFTTDPPPVPSPRTTLFPIPSPMPGQEAPFAHLLDDDFHRDFAERVTLADVSRMGDTDSVRANDPTSRPPSAFSVHSQPDQPLVPPINEHWRERNPDTGPLRWAHAQLREAARRDAMQVGAAFFSGGSPSEEAVRQMNATLAASIQFENERAPPPAYSSLAQDHSQRSGNMWRHVRSMFVVSPFISSREACLSLLRMLCAHMGHVPMRDILHLIHALENNDNADSSSDDEGDEDDEDDEDDEGEDDEGGGDGDDEDDEDDEGGNDDGAAGQGETQEHFDFIMSLAERHHRTHSSELEGRGYQRRVTLSGPYIYSPLPYSPPFGTWDGSMSSGLQAAPGEVEGDEGGGLEYTDNEGPSEPGDRSGGGPGAGSGSGQDDTDLEDIPL